MVQTISRDAFETELDEALALAGMTRALFIERGRADDLESEELRTLWLIAGPVLLLDG